MNIAIIISSLRFGGAEKQAVIDAELLAREHNVTFMAFEGGPLREQLPPGVRFIELRKTSYPATALRLARILRRLEIDLVHAHLFAPMLISGLATLRCRAVAVWNFHSHAYQDAGKGRRAHSLISKLPGVKRILFPSRELLDYYQAEGFTFPAGKRQVFYNSGQFWDRQTYRDRANGTLEVGFVGRIVPLKRVHLLVDLAHRLRQEGLQHCRISVVGDGDALAAVRAKAEDLGVKDLMAFHGFQTDTRSYYERFSIFALPSEEEVLSLSLIDAQLIGLPCIAFQVGGNADIVEDGQTGFVVTEKAEFLDRLVELVRDANLRQRMGRRAIEVSTQKFSQRARLENLQHLFTSVCNP